MKKNLLHIRLAAVVVCSAMAVAASAVTLTHKSAAAAEANQSGSSLKVPLAEGPVATRPLSGGSFAPIVKKVAPAVVKIVTTSTLRDTPAQQWPGFEDPFWRHFFGDQFGQVFPRHPSGPQRQQGLGSGVIVTKDGYILTNNHVVDHADQVKVTLQDGREFNAKVIGRDAKSDIAVVKIDATGLPVVPMADSSNVQVGDIVLAIGNPFGVGQTVTEGIVSAKDRGNMGIEDYEDFIQTDAAINPGNSGGALVDIDGRLIGINTAILSDSGGNQGIGFAIPSDLARSVMTSLVKYGHVTRGYLGLMIQDITPALAKEFDIKDTTGALVGEVVPNGPAARAGFKDGDVVVKFNGKRVTDSRQLRLEAAQTAPGTTVPVQILRDGSAKTLTVTLKSLPGSEQVAENNANRPSDKGTLNGVAVEDLSAEARQELHVPSTVKGAVVAQVEPESAAAQAGLQQGDVIEEINRHPVKNADQAVRLTENAKDKHTLLRVWSKGGSHYLVVDESQTKAG